MAPLIVLIVALLLARGLGAWKVRSLDSWPAATRVGLAAMFCFTAIAHFNDMRHELAQMLPPWLPNPEFMILFTGVCEVAGAIGLLIPRTRRIAAICLILFLIAVLPANIHAAQEGVLLRGAPVTPVIPRILMQIVFIALTGWSGFVAARR
jgi:uncharacterized membrane protein